MIGGWWLCECKESERVREDELIGRYIVPFVSSPISEADLRRVKGYSSNPSEALLYVSTGKLPSTGNVLRPEAVVAQQVPEKPSVQTFRTVRPQVPPVK